MNIRRFYSIVLRRLIATFLIIIISFLAIGAFAQKNNDILKNEIDKTIEQVNKFLVEGEYEQVLNLIDNALSLDSSNPSLYFVKGVAEENLGQIDNAIISYTIAIQLNKDYQDALYNLGVQLLNRATTESKNADSLSKEMQNDYCQALGNFTKYYELKPVDTEVESVISLINEELKRPLYYIEPIGAEKKHLVVEQMPLFIGGDEKMYQFISSSIAYPEEAKKKGISGRVFVTFTIEKDGSLTNVQAIKGIGGGCEEEAVRVIESMPNWIPGTQRGEPIRVPYRMPLKFSLGESEK